MILDDCKRLLELAEKQKLPWHIFSDDHPEGVMGDDAEYAVAAANLAPKLAKAIVRVRQRIADCIAASEPDAVHVRMTVSEASKLLALLE